MLMAIHSLSAVQTVPASLEACWNFFSDPRNLRRITPANLDFQVLTDVPERVYPGMMIEYRVRPLWGIRMTWLTEITHVEPMRYFADEQRVGPYALWHHEHFFTSRSDGLTEIRDLVHYVLPFGWLGDLAHPLLVKPQLDQIFGVRRRVVDEIFGKDRSAEAAS